MRLITAEMPEARNIRVWLNFKEVTNSTFCAELSKYPYMPTLSVVGMITLDSQDHMTNGELSPKRIYRRGLVWWIKRDHD